MLPGRGADVRLCQVKKHRWLPALLSLLVLLSSSLAGSHCTTVEHDFHIVHNLENRSPEIDPFWYVGRGVRPIGRFGKRHSSMETLTAVEPVVRTLEKLLKTLRDKDNLDGDLAKDDTYWLT